MTDSRTERVARAMCAAHDALHDRNGRGALVAYNAGASPAVTYWDALATAALTAIDEERDALRGALEPFEREIDRLEREYGFDRPTHQLQPLMLPLMDLLILREAARSLSSVSREEN